jgi:hypothetical protein
MKLDDYAGKIFDHCTDAMRYLVFIFQEEKERAERLFWICLEQGYPLQHTLDQGAKP